MISLFLAFDEDDDVMGIFNRGCVEDFEYYFDEGHPVKPKYLKSQTLNSANIELQLINNNDIFVFSAYSHGYEDRLVAKNSSYIDIYNVSLFKNSFFYTVSCSSAVTLADQLIASGCLCYFGYKCLFNYWDGYREFSECANYGLFKFFEGVATDEVYNQMIEKYNECIDRLVEENDDGYFQASLLRENRDGLVRKGAEVSINDFN